MSAKGNSNSGHKVLVRIVPVGFDEAFRKITSSLNEINKSITKSDKSLLSSVKNMERLVKQMERVQSKSERFAKDTASAMKEISNAHKTGKKIGEEFAREYKKAVKEESKKQRDLGNVANDFNRVMNRGLSGILLELGRTVGKVGNGQSTDGGTLGKVMRSGFMQQAARLAVIGGALGIIGHGVGKIVDSLAHLSPHIQALLKIMDVMATLVFLPFGQFIFSIFKPIMILMLRYMILPFAKFMGMQVKAFDDFNKTVDKALTGDENFPVMELAEALSLAVLAGLAMFYLKDVGKGLSGALTGAIGKFFGKGGSGSSSIIGAGAKNCIDLCQKTMNGISSSVKEGTKEGLKEGLKNGVKIGAPIGLGGAVLVTLFGSQKADGSTEGSGSSSKNDVLEDLEEDVTEFGKEHKEIMEGNADTVKDTQKDLDKFKEAWDEIWNSTVSTIDTEGKSLKDLFDNSMSLTKEEQDKLNETIKTKYQEVFGSISNTSQNLIDQSEQIINLVEIGHKSLGDQWEDLSIELSKIGIQTTGNVSYYMKEFADYASKNFSDNKEALGITAGIITSAMLGNWDEAKSMMDTLTTKITGVNTGMLPIWGAIFDAAESAGFEGQKTWEEVQYQLQIVGGESKKVADKAKEVGENTAFSWIGFGEDIKDSIDDATPKVEDAIDGITDFTKYIDELLKGVPINVGGGGASSGGGSGGSSGSESPGNGSSGGGGEGSGSVPVEQPEVIPESGYYQDKSGNHYFNGRKLDPNDPMDQNLIENPDASYTGKIKKFDKGNILKTWKKLTGEGKLSGSMKGSISYILTALDHSKELADIMDSAGGKTQFGSKAAGYFGGGNDGKDIAKSYFEKIRDSAAGYINYYNNLYDKHDGSLDNLFTDLSGAYDIGLAYGGTIAEEIFGIGKSGRRYRFGEFGRREFVIPESRAGAGVAASGGGLPMKGIGSGVNITVPIQVYTQKDIDSDRIAYIVKKAIKDEIDRYSRGN